MKQQIKKIRAGHYSIIATDGVPFEVVQLHESNEWTVSEMVAGDYSDDLEPMWAITVNTLRDAKDWIN